jgi:mono/diheme cytochrome c family protein
MKRNVLVAAASCTALLSAAAQVQAAAPAAGLAKVAATAAVAPSVQKVALKLSKGADLFANYGCGGCHTLAAAGATGRVGPSLDGNATLDQAYIVDRVTNGQGMMPSFGAQLSPVEITALAAYVMDTKAR